MERLVCLLFLLAPLVAQADELARDCPQFFQRGEPPKILDGDALGLCYGSYAVLYSQTRRTPIYAAERLTPEILQAAQQLNRKGAFHVERRVPKLARSRPGDYTNSGYQRGHMAPAGDQGDPADMRNSFSMANIVPQRPNNNQVIWAAIERSAQHYTQDAGVPVYVISGPVYGPHPQWVRQRVAVPDYFFKILYNSSSGEVKAYWLGNTDDAKVEEISYQELTQRLEYELLPGLNLSD